jgi:hypothetical protein
MPWYSCGGGNVTTKLQSSGSGWIALMILGVLTQANLDFKPVIRRARNMLEVCMEPQIKTVTQILMFKPAVMGHDLHKLVLQGVENADFALARV